MKLATMLLLCAALRADLININSSDGPYSFLDFYGSRLSYASSSDTVRYNNDAGFCFDPCQMGASTGPLIQADGDTWTFGAGGSVSIYGLTDVLLPQGFTPDPADQFAACFAAGLLANYRGGPPCAADGNISGQFTGNTTVIFSPGKVYIDGPAAFTISDTLAIALGITAGAYAGDYEAYITWDSPADPLSGFSVETRWAEQYLGGYSAPEPASIMLLGLAFLGAAIIKRRLR